MKDVSLFFATKSGACLLLTNKFVKTALKYRLGIGYTYVTSNDLLKYKVEEVI